MIEIQRGFRGKIEDYWDLKNDIAIGLNIAGPRVYDSVCFGLDANDKLSDDSYMVFYNQLSSPNSEIVNEKTGNDSLYRFNLSKLPAKINKLSFTISIDSGGTISQAGSLSVTLSQKDGGAKKEMVSLNLTGRDFGEEKALICVEVYKKNDIWRFAALASGFKFGLSSLLKHYGGEEASSPPPSAAPPASKISLEKRLERDAPELVSLAKPLRVILEKNKLTDTVARVGLVVDISGSMRVKYRDGKVQDVVNKTVPLAVQFDDDGELDFWFYGAGTKRMKSITLKTYRWVIGDNWQAVYKTHGGGNNEREAIKLVMEEYENSKLPAYILFITDGGVRSESEIKKLLIEASKLPIFWQFVGLGGKSYGILERLDTMPGRFIDNANFFAIDSFNEMSDETLYGKLLGEFPQWLSEARQKGVIKP
jgi:stress response protein SCP2